MPNSDIMIKCLIDYFEAEGSIQDKQEVFYYAGSIYRDLQDTPRALENFFKSLDYANCGECDSVMLRNTYSNLHFLQYRVQNYEEALKIAEDLNDTEFISKVLEDYAKALEGESLSKAIEIYERIGTDEAKARIDVLSEYAQYEGTYVSSSWKKIGGRYGLEGEVTYDDDADELTIFIRDGKYYYEFDECQGELGTDAVGQQYGLEITVHFDYKKKYIEHVVDPHYDYFYQEVTEYYKKE